MNDPARLFPLTLCLSLLLPGATARAEPGAGAAEAAPTELTAEQAVWLALQQSPSFRSSALAYEQADARVRGEQGAFPWNFQADAGITHSESPTLGQTGDIVTSSTDTLGGGAQLDKEFPTGTSLSLRVEGDRYDTDRPLTAQSGAIPSYGDQVGYDMAARATVTQPLLQGRGREIGLAPLRTARIARTQAERARDLAASELARDVLTAYWEAWYASRTVDLEREALKLAAEQRRAAEARRDAGALAPVEVLVLANHEAELQESLVSALGTVRQRRLVLDQLVGGRVAAANLVGDPPAEFRLPSEAALVESLETSSPELAELAERVRLAEEQAKTATEPYRARLDLESYAEARGLGDGALPPAVGQVARLAALSAPLGLVYRTPLDARQRSAARAEAALAVSMARSNLEAARQRVLASALTLTSQARTARAQYEAAKKTAEISEQLFRAEQQRFEAGTSTPLQVKEAEDSLRQSRQRVERARVDLALSAIQLQHATGELLERYLAPGAR